MKEGFFSWLLTWTGFGAGGRGANFKAGVLSMVADRALCASSCLPLESVDYNELSL